jgi:hypothetical protein
VTADLDDVLGRVQAGTLDLEEAERLLENLP